MLTIEKALKLTSSIEIDEQINDRRELMKQLVGDLYPNILMGEIMRLREYKLILNNVPFSLPKGEQL